MSRCCDVIRTLAGVALLAAGIAMPASAASPDKPAAAQPKPAAAAGTYGFGKAATPAEIAGWDIDVRPDGKGLPKGRGTVAQGQEIYDAKCAACHGTFGESTDYLALAGGVGTLTSNQPQRTVGSKLNYATTLFDYIRRAMPFPTPQTLTVDETYALTAYVLNLNDILPADAALDQDSLPKVKMPNRDGFTTDHGFMHRDGKPDTRNVACMKDCVKEVRLSSEFPVSELDSHGNLVEQTRALGGTAGTAAGAPAPAAAPKAATAADLAKKSGCLACHAVANKVVGPSYKDIATKYAGDGGAEGRLVAKVKAGGAGAWGQVPMPPHPQLSEAEVRALVQWILGGAR